MAEPKSSRDQSCKTPTNYDPGAFFWQTRQKGASLLGIVIFTTLRALDVPLQYWLLQSGTAASLLHRLNATITATQPPPTTFPGLSPYHTLLLGLATGSSLKQIYWKLFVGQEVMGPGFAAGIAVYNTILNGLNALLAVWAVTSQQPVSQQSLSSFISTSPLALQFGLVLYSTGLLLEWYSEIQRKTFKAHPYNKGKPYAGGLWALARNINYGGYTLWRMGYGLVCGGWVWGGVVGVWLAGDLIGRAIPSMDVYCEKRYGRQWEEVRRKGSV